MSNDWPLPLRIEAARRDLSILCDSANLLRRAGQGSATLEHAIKHKRVELNDLIARNREK